jgi:hypothetical protein
MFLLARLVPVARLALAPALAITLAGCLGMGDSKPEVTATTDPVAADPVAAAPAATSAEAGAADPKKAGADEIDIRRYLGPNYCPELRIRPGSQLLRRYESGHQDDAAYVIWQASIGKTARECLYDLQGNLTLRIGVSGRVISGPKGGPGAVAVPLRISVEKYQEKALSNQPYPLNITIPPEGSAVFSEVREITVPSPGKSRDYVVYVGIDQPPKPPPPRVVVRTPRPVRPAGAQPATPAKQRTQPNVLPTPSTGFILGQ